jgi:di/tricarboxylate transporter
MPMRLSTETKNSFKTTEFFAMVAVVAGILAACYLVGRGSGADNFQARQAWLYVAIVAVGYMVSRGLAKSGSRDAYWADANDIPGRDDADDALGRAGN